MYACACMPTSVLANLQAFVFECARPCERVFVRSFSCAYFLECARV